MLDSKLSYEQEPVSTFQVSTCQMRWSREHVIEIQSRFRSKQVLLDTFHGLNRLNPISFAANGGLQVAAQTLVSTQDCVCVRLPNL